MKKVLDNERKNAKLNELYHEKTREFLEAWHKHYNFKSIERINEFGIINVDCYDADNGILFIGKETNGWDYSEGITFRQWVEKMAKHNVVSGKIAAKHPQIWYNLSRWAIFITNPQIDKSELVKSKDISGLKRVAITNFNKAEGESASGKEFWNLIKEDIVVCLLSREIDIIKPNLIVLCGMKKNYIPQIVQKIDRRIKIIEMPHPSARNISKMDMILRLENELKKVEWSD